MARAKVIIRYWSTSIKEGGVGHVSLETIHDDGTSGIYVSFWPHVQDPKFQYPLAQEAKYTIKRSADGSSYLRTSLYDLTIGEGRPPEETIDLLSLDIFKIEQKFNLFKDSDFKWEIWGSSVFSSEQNQNCSGLVFSLLHEAGFTDLISFSTRMKIGMQWAPSGALVALCASPFVIFLVGKIVNEVAPFLGGPGCAYASSIYVGSTPNVPFSEEAFKKFFDVSQFAEFLYSTNEKISSIGLAISLVITLAAIGYISFAGMGAVAKFAVITPADTYSYVKEAENRESTYLSGDSFINTIIDEMNHIVQHLKKIFSSDVENKSEDPQFLSDNLITSSYRFFKTLNRRQMNNVTEPNLVPLTVTTRDHNHIGPRS